MEKIEFSQKELIILSNLIYSVTLKVADAKLVVPILEKIESKIVKPEEPVEEKKVFKEVN